MITIMLNDEKIIVPKNALIIDVLVKHSIDLHSVAIALNSVVVPKAQWQNTVCHADDSLDVFSVVAGG